MKTLERIFFGILSGILVAGCSTLKPYSSGRKGMFDHLDEYAQNPIHPRGRELASAKMSEGRLREIQRNTDGWRWPLRTVQVTSPFGHRGRSFHDGIDLRASSGTPVYAAQSGSVVYADRRISGYGRMVVIQHDSGLSSIYAHNSKLMVRKGEKVKRGQQIALSGSTGHASGPHLHFEIRDGATAVNPDTLLHSGRRLSSQDSEIENVALQN